jgi:hypothetical protein
MAVGSHVKGTSSCTVYSEWSGKTGGGGVGKESRAQTDTLIKGTYRTK